MFSKMKQIKWWHWLLEKIDKLVGLSIWRWFSLERIDQWIGLFVKFAGVITLLVAIDFFSLKPNIETSYHAIIRYLDSDEVRTSYTSAGKTIPPVVGDVLNSPYPPLFPFSAPSKEEVEKLKEIFGSTLTDLGYVTALEGLSTEDRDFAIETLRGATYTLVQVTVSNSGRAEGHDISLQISPVYSFTLVSQLPASYPSLVSTSPMCSKLDPTESFSLEPGKSIPFCFRQPLDRPELLLLESTEWEAEQAIKVKWDPTVVLAAGSLGVFLYKEWRGLEDKESATKVAAGVKPSSGGTQLPL
jgi:hypothetical protein